jgi:hypothetical protein
MSFNNYHADSFTDLLYKKVDELTYKIVSVTLQVNVVQQFLNDQGITLPEGGGGNSSNSAPDSSAQMLVLQQLVNSIPVPNTCTTVSLTEFIYRVLQAYTIITNYQPHLEHLPILPLLGYEIFTWGEVIAAAKKIPASFVTSTLQTMNNNINSLMSGKGGGSSSGGGSSDIDYSTKITVLQAVATKIPGFLTTSTLHLLSDDLAAIKNKVYTLPMLPNPHSQDITWDEVINAAIKIN